MRGLSGHVVWSVIRFSIDTAYVAFEDHQMDPWDSPIARRRLKLWPNHGTRRTAAKRLLAGDALNDILAAFPRGPRTTKDNGALASRTARRTYAQYALRQEAVYAGLVPPIDPANVATIRGEARKQDIAWIACRTGLNPEKVKAILKLKGPARNSGASGGPAAAVPADPDPAMSAQVRQCIAGLAQAPKLPLRTLGELESPALPGHLRPLVRGRAALCRDREQRSGLHIKSSGGRHRGPPLDLSQRAPDERLHNRGCLPVHRPPPDSCGPRLARHRRGRCQADARTNEGVDLRAPRFLGRRSARLAGSRDGESRPAPRPTGLSSPRIQLDALKGNGVSEPALGPCRLSTHTLPALAFASATSLLHHDPRLPRPRTRRGASAIAWWPKQSSGPPAWA